MLNLGFLVPDSLVVVTAAKVLFRTGRAIRVVLRELMAVFGLLVRTVFLVVTAVLFFLPVCLRIRELVFEVLTIRFGPLRFDETVFLPTVELRRGVGALVTVLLFLTTVRLVTFLRG